MRVVISIAVFLVIAGGVAFFSVPAIKEARRSKMIEAEIENLRTEAEKINSENNFLREKIEYLKSDHFKESVAKDRLNLRNKGEKVVVVQPNAEKEDNSKKTLGEETTTESFGDETEKPNYKKWWEIIMK
ncbi:MAG: copper transporter [Candidatus Moranbacteria bacterium]|jgi:cell division protein FtsB|nr:copper transporter [Candidatus Moranbacteria bacterium]NCA94106.1 hypothetical protein [Sphingobacteriia bacterium]NLC30899.1 copper transporter [Candidatus Moranbacteria bacterium]